MPVAQKELNQLEGHIVDLPKTIILLEEGPSSLYVLVELTSRPNEDLTKLEECQVRDALV